MKQMAVNSPGSPSVYGYARVSTKDQFEDRQIYALKKYPVPEANIFVDKLSGKDFNRPNYKKLLRKLKCGDTLVVESIDRLGRNYNEILDQWRVITKTKKANIVVLDMPLLDTTKSRRDLTGTFVEDMVLQILSYVAQTEREKILQRQKEGIEAAKKRGVRFGRPPKIPPNSFNLIKKEWLEQKITSRRAAQQLGVSQSTFLRWVRNSHGAPAPPAV